MKALFLALSLSPVWAASPFDTWTVVTPPGETAAFKTVAFGQGKFLAGAANGKLYSSTDGANWTSVSNPNPYDFAHLIFFRNRFFATTSESPQRTALYDSPDGVAWTFRVSQDGDFGAWDTVLFWQGKYQVAGRSRGASSSDLLQWTIHPNGTQEAVGIPETAVGNENVYIWTGIGTYSRAVTANSVTTLTSLYQHPVVYLEPNFLSVATATSAVQRSTDGINWSPLGGNLPPIFLRSLIQANGQFIIDSGDKIYVSSDFSNWTGYTAPSTFSRTAMAAGNSVVVRISDSGVIYRSQSLGDSAPVFLKHPEHVTVEAQNPFSLTVTVSGSLPISLQWRKDLTPIPGAIGSTYSIASADVSNSGDYDVIAQNSFGSVTSRVGNVLVDFFGIKSYAGLTLTGSIGQRYRIDYRQGVTTPNWTPLTEVTLTAPKQVWIDYDSPENSGRFYRSVFLP